MSNNLLAGIIPFEYIPNNKGEPLTGSVYIGQLGKDPRQYPQLIYWDPASTIIANQPLKVVNGFIVNNGAPAIAYTNTNYSTLVLDANGVQQYYVPDFYLSGNTAPITQSVFNTFLQSLASGTGSTLVGYTAPGSTFTQTVQNRLGQYLSVKDFGAVGDGVTNDTSSIQNAINAAAGKTLFFPTGTYLVDTLNISSVSNSEFFGENSILSLHSSGNLINIDGSTHSDPNITIVFRNFIFQGNNKTASTLFNAVHVHGVKIENCQFYNTAGSSSYHLHLASCWVFEANNCYFQAAGSQCSALAFLDTACQQSSFMNCRFLSNSTGDGVLIKDTINTNWINCDFEGNQYGTRLICSSGLRCDSNNFIGCDWENNGVQMAIGGTGTTDPVVGTFVSGNFVSSSSAHGSVLVLDKAIRTQLIGISLGNTDVSTTANTQQTFYRVAYGGTPTQGSALNIADTSQWIDMNNATGTFLPTLRSDTGQAPGSYNSQVGTYTRNGRTVYVAGVVYWTGWVSPSGALQLVLPFKFKNQTNLQQQINISSGGAGFTYTSGNQICALGQSNTNYATFFQFNNSAQSPIAPSGVGVIFFSGTYQIEDV
jgi:hypothetical protein